MVHALAKLTRVHGDTCITTDAPFPGLAPPCDHAGKPTLQYCGSVTATINPPGPTSAACSHGQLLQLGQSKQQASGGGSGWLGAGTAAMPATGVTAITGALRSAGPNMDSATHNKQQEAVRTTGGSNGPSPATAAAAAAGGDRLASLLRGGGVMRPWSWELSAEDVEWTDTELADGGFGMVYQGLYKGMKVRKGGSFKCTSEIVCQISTCNEVMSAITCSTQMSAPVLLGHLQVVIKQLKGDLSEAQWGMFAKEMGIMQGLPRSDRIVNCIGAVQRSDGVCGLVMTR